LFSLLSNRRGEGERGDRRGKGKIIKLAYIKE